jgi:glycosyltransferase involved in cell wall biosynthesis
MRIGLLIYGSLETLSGGYLYDRKLVDHLRRQGDQVEIISLPWRNYLIHLQDNFSFSLLRRLEQLRVDFLLQDELNHPSLFYLNRLVHKRAGYPLIAIVHHLLSSEARPAWQNRLYRQIERRYLESVDGFVYNSQTTCRVVETLVKNRLPGVVAFPAGDRLLADISEDQIAARARQPGPLRLFFLGNIIPRKGLHTLVEAVNELPRKAWTLSVAGSQRLNRSYANQIRKKVAAYDLQEHIRFMGPLQEAEVIDQMHSSHVLVVPSSYEGFGIAYLEGMGFGLPAIASTGGAAKEIITPGLDGFLIPPGDSSALAQTLGLLVEDRELLLATSLAARRRYAAHPTWEETGASVRNFLKTFGQELQSSDSELPETHSTRSSINLR